MFHFKSDLQTSDYKNNGVMFQALKRNSLFLLHYSSDKGEMVTVVNRACSL